MNTRDIIAPPAPATTRANKIAADVDFTDRHAEGIDRILRVHDFRAIKRLQKRKYPGGGSQCQPRAVLRTPAN
jgi:hypothetical protein